jgi:predicted RNA binding protein YcfA (HicA-like mRNA interferase family)
VLSGREVCRILIQQGFTEVRRKGSHVVMQKRAGGTTSRSRYPIMPRFGSEHCLPSSIIRQSQLPRELFEAE